MKMRRFMAVALVVLVCALTGCGKASSSANAPSFDESDSMASSESVSEESWDSAETGSSAPQVSDPSRKLIKRQSYNVQTKEFDTLLEELEKLISESEGYVEYSEISGNTYNDAADRYADYTIRIPVDHLTDFKEKLEEKASIIRFSEQVEDVTLNYVDTESHIKALKAEQESLMAMLEKAEDLESIIAIQNQLTSVRYQLESYESQLRSYDNLIQYSTIDLRVYEVEREIQTSKSFGGQLKERLSSNLYNLQQGLYTFALWFLGALPYWVVIGIVGAVVFRIVKRRVKKGKKNKSKKNLNPGEITPGKVPEQTVTEHDEKKE